MTYPLAVPDHWPTHPSICSDRQQATFLCKRTRRRGSVALKVTPERLSFLAPDHLSESQLKTTFKNHQAWLFSSLDHQLKRLAQQRQSAWFQFRPDQPFVLLDQSWTWALNASETLKPGAKPKATMDAERRHWQVSVSSDDWTEVHNALEADPCQVPALLKPAFRQLCQSQLEAWLAKRLPERAAELNVTPNEWQVKQYRARWGSCDHKGRVRFHWALALMPEAVADYVLVHELCHLIHFNHSNRFWQQVARHSPNFQEAERFLKQEGAGLMWL